LCDFRVIRLENGLTALLISDVLQGDDDCMKKDDEGKQLILCMLLSADKDDTHPICIVHEEFGTFNKKYSLKPHFSLVSICTLLIVSEVEGDMTV